MNLMESRMQTLGLTTPAEPGKDADAPQSVTEDAMIRAILWDGREALTHQPYGQSRKQEARILYDGAIPLRAGMVVVTAEGKRYRLEDVAFCPLCQAALLQALPPEDAP